MRTILLGSGKCCFQCKIDNISNQVDDLIDDMPQDANEICIQQMLLPALARLSEIAPKITPRAWMDETMPMPTCPTTLFVTNHRERAKAKIAIRYWDLCLIVRAPAKTIDRTLLERFYCLSNAIIHEYNSIPHVNKTLLQCIWYQNSLIINSDPVVDAVFSAAESNIIQTRYMQVTAFEEWGCLEYARTLSKAIRENQPHAALNDLEVQIEKTIQTQIQCRWILAVAIKDDGSKLHALGSDLILTIVRYTQDKKKDFIYWENVLARYLKYKAKLTIQ